MESGSLSKRSYHLKLPLAALPNPNSLQYLHGWRAILFRNGALDCDCLNFIARSSAVCKNYMEGGRLCFKIALSLEAFKFHNRKDKFVQSLCGWKAILPKMWLSLETSSGP